MKKKHTKTVIINGKRYDYYDKKVTMPDGKRKDITAKNKVAWDKKYAQVMQEFNSNIRPHSKVMTVKDISTEYLADFHQTDAPKTYYGRVHHLDKYINPEIGHITARNLSTNRIRQFYRDVTAVRGHKKVEQINKTLRHMLNWAQSNELGITSNPITSDVMDRLRRTGRRKNRLQELQPDKQVFSLEEASMILTAAVNKREEVIIQLQLLHGLRISEALAIRWSDIDLQNGEIHVSRQVSSTPKKYRTGTSYESDNYLTETHTKTEHSNRHVPLHDKTRELLSLTPEDERIGLVFATAKSTPMSASNYTRRIFRPSMKSLGFEFKTHDLRKMYGSFLYDQGVNIVTLSRWMGHSSPSITLNIYAKVVVDRQSSHAFPVIGQSPSKFDSVVI